jgi:hypothetical protein
MRALVTWWLMTEGVNQVDTPEGRCLAFTNTLQHRVKGVTNDSNEPAVRKILCFFLIDPDHRYHHHTYSNNVVLSLM